MLKFDERRKDEAECQNLESIYGIKNIPSDSRMREICDEIDPKKYLSPIFKVPFRHLQRGKALEPMVFYKGCYLLNLDGTGFFSSKKISAPYCALLRVNCCLVLQVHNFRTSKNYNWSNVDIGVNQQSHISFSFSARIVDRILINITNGTYF